MPSFPASELQRNAAEIQRAALMGPVFLTYHDKPRYVMMSLEEFVRLQGEDVTANLAAYPKAVAARVRELAKAPAREPAEAPGPFDAGPEPAPAAVDKMVLATVNAPYKRSIDAATLRKCLATQELDRWLVHVATFFNVVAPEFVFKFADQHGISRSALRKAYLEMRRRTGERNSNMEDHLVAMASSSRSNDQPSRASTSKRKRGA
jgi:hypothetical protein